MAGVSGQVLDEKETSLFKRAPNETYHLKMKASRSPPPPPPPAPPP